ncbi:MAG: phosphotransferase [Caldilineaceae bacterium]|nr:phosphotransferase [Caldilineaceae bacterium]
MKQTHEQLSLRLMSYLRAEFDDTTLRYAAPLHPIQGGFETQIFLLQLQSERDVFPTPWVVRLYPERSGPRRRSGTAQFSRRWQIRAMPVPRCHLLCSDLSVLGGSFFIMDFLAGEPLAKAPGASAPTLLGQAHAKLHKIDPERLIQAFDDQQIHEARYRLDNRFADLATRTRSILWLGPAVDWLIENRPSEPETLAICHGDFHPFNILAQDGVVTGVLDWPGFVIADPVLDVAATMVLMTIPVKQLAPALGLELTADDIDLFVRTYLQAYQAERSLDLSHLDYYRAWRCVHALLEGVEGQESWQHPRIVEDLQSCVYEVTGLRVVAPM